MIRLFGFTSFVFLLVGCILFFLLQVEEKPVLSVDSHITGQLELSHAVKTINSETMEEFIDRPKEKPISIIFAGDALFDWSVKETIRAKGPDYPFEFVKAEVEKADYAVVNLETAVTDTANQKDTTQLYNFKSDPIALEGLVNAGFDMVSLANNHALDYQLAGFLDTIRHVENYGLEYIGAGQNEQEAYGAKRVTIKGKELKFMGFSRFMPSTTWYAGVNKPGIASAYQEEKVIEAIKRESSEGDLLFVYIHWGVEKNNQPEHWQRDYARRMIEAGADAIIGAHPHVLQGFEYINGKPVAYSLGNFLFPDYVKGKTAETGLLTLTIQEDKIGMSFSPYTIHKDQIKKVDETERKRLLSYLEAISYGVTLQEHYIVSNE
ncbi:CapA family protein [Bacillus timonensis]|nr:CapA family protein [Bacillus timonensis]